MAAPGGDRLGDAVEETLVGVQGEFVEGDMAAFAGQRIWIGGKGIDAAAVGELDDVRGGVGGAVEKELAAIGESDFHEVGPVTAVIELEAGLRLVARRDESVEAGAPGADEKDQAIAITPGEAGLAGFDAELQRGIVFDPEALRFVEVLSWDFSHLLIFDLGV